MPTNPNLTAVIYRRVSTAKQAEKGYSLPEQLETCQVYAQSHGLHVVGQFFDAHTGAEHKRPQFDALLAAVEAQGVGHVIVSVPDRLGRGTAASMARYLIGQAGAQLHFADSGPVGTSDDDQTSQEMKDLISGIERRSFARRSARGRAGAVKAGKVIAAQPAFGYRLVKGRLEIIPEEAELVREIFHLYIGGASQAGIAVLLSERGIPTKSLHTKKRGPTAWNSVTIRKMLANRTYTGVWTYRSALAGPLTVKVPAIIDAATFEAAQTCVSRHKIAARRRRRIDAPYLFVNGRAKCAVCGGTLSAYFAGPNKEYLYYRCKGMSRDRVEDGFTVTCRPWRGEALESLVWEAVEELITSIDLVEYIRSQTERRLAALDAMASKLEDKERAIAYQRGRLERAANEIVVQPGAIMRSIFQDMIVEGEATITRLQAERDALEAQLRQEFGRESAMQTGTSQQLLEFCAAALDAGELQADVFSDLVGRMARQVEPVAEPARRREWFERLDCRLELSRPERTALLHIGDVQQVSIELTEYWRRSSRTTRSGSA